MSVLAHCRSCPLRSTGDFPFETVQLAQRILNDSPIIFTGGLDIELRPTFEIHFKLPMVA